MKRIKNLSLGVFIVLAVAAAAGTALVGTLLSPGAVEADHAVVYPELDNRCYIESSNDHIYRTLLLEHGWNGLKHPDDDPDADYYNYRYIPMFSALQRSDNIRSKGDHYSAYYREVSSLLSHLELVDMWHEIPIRFPETGDLALYTGKAWKYVVRYKYNAQRPPCFYRYGPGLPEPAPEPAGGGESDDSATTTDSG